MSSTPDRHPAPAPVWIIDAEQWPRACLRAELIERGHEAVGLETVREALLLLALPGVRPQLVIIDLAGQKIDGRQLAALARGGRPVIGIGGAVECDQEAVRAFPWSALLRRPVSLGAIADLVGDLLDPVSASTPPRTGH